MATRRKPPIKPARPIRPGREDSAASRIRRNLAIMVTALLIVIALIATFQIGAMPVLDKLLPLVAIIFGLFYGHRAGKL